MRRPFAWPVAIWDSLLPTTLMARGRVWLNEGAKLQIGDFYSLLSKLLYYFLYNYYYLLSFEYGLQIGW